jgi:diguanylate cyclase (GGDEF)-like protein
MNAVVIGMPIMATNSRTVFDLYFVAILMSGLRADWRLCVWAAAVSVAGYVGVCLGGSWFLNRLPIDPSSQELYGIFNWMSVEIRVAWLLVAGVVAAILVKQGRRFRSSTGVDVLTGLAERRAFVERAIEEMRRARGTRGVALAVIDVDDFRGIEKGAGPGRAERGLLALARAIDEHLRPGDFAARFGGQEFVVAFVEVGVEEAVEAAEELRKALGRVRVVCDGELAHLTVCIGVGCWPIDGDAFEDVLARADARLFYAKQEGPDRVVGPPKPRLATVTELVKS